MYKKTKVFFSFFISCNFEFYLMNALVYVDVDQGLNKVKLISLELEHFKLSANLFSAKSEFIV